MAKAGQALTPPEEKKLKTDVVALVVQRLEAPRMFPTSRLLEIGQRK